MGVHNSPFRSQYRTLSLHQTDTSDPSMGTQPGYTNQRILGRFDLHSNQLSTGSSAHSNGSQQTSVTRMDNQLGQIGTHTDSAIGTLGFPSGHSNNGISGTNSKNPGFEEIITTGSTTASADTETYSQLDDEDTSSNVCTSTSTSVHTTSSSTQESNCPTVQRLGPTTTSTTGMPEGNSNMDASTTAVEREVFSIPNTKGNAICGRERYGMGCHWQQQTTHGYWNQQEAQQSINWRELEAVFLAIQSFNIQNTNLLIRIDNTTSLSYICCIMVKVIK